MNSKVGDRQIRSDKKVDLKATMSAESKCYLHDFSKICGEPMKDVAERLTVLAAVSRDVIQDICVWFRRDYFYLNSVAYGDAKRPKLSVKSKGKTEIVSIKFKRKNYDTLCAVAYALDITPSAAASVLIVLTMRNPHFMAQYVNVHLSHLEESRITAIKKFLNL